jgi:hypothetical protein
MNRIAHASLFSRLIGFSAALGVAIVLLAVLASYRLDHVAQQLTPAASADVAVPGQPSTPSAGSASDAGLVVKRLHRETNLLTGGATLIALLGVGGAWLLTRHYRRQFGGDPAKAMELALRMAATRRYHQPVGRIGHDQSTTYPDHRRAG